MQIEKKLKQTTLEPSAQVGETNETAATDFRGSFEIDQFQCGRQLNMTERRKTERRFFPPFANERVIVGAVADRGLEMREVRQGQEQIALVFVRWRHLSGLVGNLLTDDANTRLHISA